MKTNLLPIFALLIVGCGNRNPANIVVENRIRQTEQTDSIIGDSYERDTIQGDFNGDGKIEYAYSESNPSEYYCLDEVDDGKPNNITFSNPTIPAIETEFQIERLTNEGDLNRDGTEPFLYAGATVLILIGIILMVAMCYEDGYSPAGFTAEEWEYFAGGIFLLLVTVAVGMYVSTGMTAAKYDVKSYNRECRMRECDESFEEELSAITECASARKIRAP